MEFELETYVSETGQKMVWINGDKGSGAEYPYHDSRELGEAVAFYIETYYPKKEKPMEFESGVSKTFHKIFTKETSDQYQDGDPIYNEAFLRSQECYYRDLLHVKDFVPLYDIYSALGFDITPEVTPETLIYGWTNEDMDSVSFNFVEFPNKKGFALSFNVRLLIPNAIQ